MPPPEVKCFLDAFKSALLRSDGYLIYPRHMKCKWGISCLASQTPLAGGQTLHLFNTRPWQNILTATSQIDMKFVIDLHGPSRLILNDFRDPVIFCPALPLGLNFPLH